MMKKIFNPVTIYFLFFGLIFMTAIGASLFNSLTEAGLNPFDYARITDVDYKATLIDEPGHGGKVVITENLTFDIHAAFRSNTFWELWRDLCEDNIEDEMVVEQIHRDVKRIVDALPESQREVLVMRYYRNMSFKEIADITNVSINTALGRMRYAIMNMRRIAEENNIILTM